MIEDLRDLESLGDVWIVEEVEDGMGASEDKGLTLTWSFSRVQYLFSSLRILRGVNHTDHYQYLSNMNHHK